MNNIPTWVSAGAAALSLIFTVVSWFLSNKSKEAKAKAEERADQAKKLLEQMQQIADSLRGPVLELIKDPEDPYYILRNNTKSSIKVLEVLNRKDFHRFGPPDLPETPQEVHPGKPIGLSLPRGADVTSLGLQIEVNGKEEPISVEIPR